MLGIYYHFNRQSVEDCTIIYAANTVEATVTDTLQNASIGSIGIDAAIHNPSISANVEIEKIETDINSTDIDGEIIC